MDPVSSPIPTLQHDLSSSSIQSDSQSFDESSAPSSQSSSFKYLPSRQSAFDVYDLTSASKIRNLTSRPDLEVPNGRAAEDEVEAALRSHSPLPQPLSANTSPILHDSHNNVEDDDDDDDDDFPELDLPIDSLAKPISTPSKPERMPSSPTIVIDASPEPQPQLHDQTMSSPQPPALPPAPPSTGKFNRLNAVLEQVRFSQEDAKAWEESEVLDVQSMNGDDQNEEGAKKEDQWLLPESKGGRYSSIMRKYLNASSESLDIDVERSDAAEVAPIVPEAIAEPEPVLEEQSHQAEEVAQPIITPEAEKDHALEDSSIQNEIHEQAAHADHVEEQAREVQEDYVCSAAAVVEAEAVQVEDDSPSQMILPTPLASSVSSLLSPVAPSRIPSVSFIPKPSPSSAHQRTRSASVLSPATPTSIPMFKGRKAANTPQSFTPSSTLSLLDRLKSPTSSIPLPVGKAQQSQLQRSPPSQQQPPQSLQTRSRRHSSASISPSSGATVAANAAAAAAPKEPLVESPESGGRRWQSDHIVNTLNYRPHLFVPSPLPPPSSNTSPTPSSSSSIPKMNKTPRSSPPSVSSSISVLSVSSLSHSQPTISSQRKNAEKKDPNSSSIPTLKSPKTPIISPAVARAGNKLALSPSILASSPLPLPAQEQGKEEVLVTPVKQRDALEDAILLDSAEYRLLPPTIAMSPPSPTPEALQQLQLAATVATVAPSPLPSPRSEKEESMQPIGITRDLLCETGFDVSYNETYTEEVDDEDKTHADEEEAEAEEENEVFLDAVESPIVKNAPVPSLPPTPAPPSPQAPPAPLAVEVEQVQIEIPVPSPVTQAAAPPSPPSSSPSPPAAEIVRQKSQPPPSPPAKKSCCAVM